MKKSCLLLTLLSLALFRAHAGTIFYQRIPATDSDANSGISSDSGYTSAVDGGNTRGEDRVVNGITLYSLAAEGDSSTADKCTVNALSGTLSNANGSASSIQADGALKDALADMTFNNGAADNSQQENHALSIAARFFRSGTECYRNLRAPIRLNRKRPRGVRSEVSRRTI